MNVRVILCCVTWLIFASSVLADIDAIRHLRLKPNDPAFDNGRVISEAIVAGKIRDTIHFPGGIYYHSTTVDDHKRRGLAFEGSGLVDWLDERSVERYARSAAIFVYNGPADQPAWRLQGLGHKLSGINIWRGFRPSKGQPSKPPDGVGLEITRAKKGPPSGKHSIEHFCVAGFDRGIFLTGINHADTLDFGFVRAEQCRASVVCDSEQANGINFRLLAINGPGEDVFDFNRGGGLNVGTLVINGKRLVFRFRKTDANSCTYRIANLKVDPGSVGWRLLEMEKPGPLNLYVRGQIGTKAIMGDQPMVIRVPKPAKSWTPRTGYQTLDVALWGPNPSGEQMWRPTLEEAAVP